MTVMLNCYESTAVELRLQRPWVRRPTECLITARMLLSDLYSLLAAQIELDEDGKEIELGKGAYGVVIKGRYRLMPVAIKRLINQSPEQQTQFLKEMAILRACRGSRYIVPFVGASLQPVRLLNTSLLL